MQLRDVLVLNFVTFGEDSHRHMDENEVFGVSMLNEFLKILQVEKRMVWTLTCFLVAGRCEIFFWKKPLFRPKHTNNHMKSFIKSRLSELIQDYGLWKKLWCVHPSMRILTGISTTF